MAFTYLIVLTLIMGGALAYGFIVGDFWEDGGELMDNPGELFPCSMSMSDSFSLSAGSGTGNVARE